MPVNFTQEFYPGQDVVNRISTGMNITPVAQVKKFKYETSLMGKDKWSIRERKKEKDDLIAKINELIDWFNKCNNDLLYTFVYDDKENRYSFQNVKEKSFRDKHLETHRNYLLEYEHEAHFDIIKMCDRLAYNRTKEFEKFLKNLENKKANVILVEIDKFKNNNFDKWKKEIQRATVHTFTFILNKVIKEGERRESLLKKKQESRKEQLLEKFGNWEKKLSNPTTSKQKDFAGAVSSLIEILKGNGRDLYSDEVKILSQCFGGSRNWGGSYEGVIAKEYLPFPRFNNRTNRVITSLYGMITDGGSKIDKMIEAYIKKLEYSGH